jgi:hypothetical protein
MVQEKQGVKIIVVCDPAPIEGSLMANSSGWFTAHVDDKSQEGP